ncbi:unnamed protein product [Trifolium pratense]|uniref:Uncharacterized protein n=1 Tax=Trifolium pratense TaxID=57577 RepID=A0ACB0KV27_TRIPR|nr:unnamed protein product [Trifolium pratense]
MNYDRAGSGESDPNPKKSLKSEVLDIQELADQLQIGAQFYVIGVSIAVVTTVLQIYLFWPEMAHRCSELVFRFDSTSTASLTAVVVVQHLDQEVQLQEQEEATIAQPSKQNSILSLTIDEFQCKRGKSFGSLNMDEFIASIWSSNDEDTTTQTQKNTKNVATTEQTISQDGNSFSVPTPICKKTVDEVWSEIHKNTPQFKEENNLQRNETLMKQQTLGELTLEDFLVKAGVVQQSSSYPFQTHSGNVLRNVTPVNLASYGLMPSMGMGFSTQCVSSNGLATYQMLSQNNNLGVQDQVGESSNRKRIINGPPDVVVERRQRRMLKNRESAARSRARRQVFYSSYSTLNLFQLICFLVHNLEYELLCNAYTVELEAELNLLKEENEKLKQVLAEAERKRKQELLHRNHPTKGQKGTEKLRAIRRPISAIW